MQQSPVEITLSVTEIKNIVNLTVLDNDNLSFSVAESKDTVHLTIKEEGDGLNLTITDGKNGLSAYEVWKEQGNHGSIDDYLNSLKGKPGPPGPTITKTSEIINDGEDGINPFITAEEADQWEKIDW